jgi:hypothetical protein
MDREIVRNVLGQRGRYLPECERNEEHQSKYRASTKYRRRFDDGRSVKREPGLAEIASEFIPTLSICNPCQRPLIFEPGISTEHYLVDNAPAVVTVGRRHRRSELPPSRGPHEHNGVQRLYKLIERVATRENGSRTISRFRCLCHFFRVHIRDVRQIRRMPKHIEAKVSSDPVLSGW